ncbi:MAG: helix-turn-helix domain-containing protein [Sporolactobacillus sp.]
MNKKDIAKILRDYFWIINEIARQRKMMSEVSANMTGQYGIESSLPHGKNGRSDPVANEVERRDKKFKWIAKLEEKALYVQKGATLITDEREKAVLECMLDGMSIIAISRHMGLSRRHVQRIRDDIADKMSQMSHLSAELSKDKTAC